MSHSLYKGDVLRYQGRLCIPNIDFLRSRILQEVHGSYYSIHSSSPNMYHEHREVFWLEGLKKEILEFVAECQNCQ